MAYFSADRDFVTEYSDFVSVSAAIDGDRWDGVLVTITHSGDDEQGCHQIGMTVADAHRIAVALYSVISELEQEVER